MASTAPSLRWRVIDIVTAAVLGVACGLIFVVWNQVGNAALEGLKAITPGLDGLATGIWLLGGTLGGYIIRKPGAALFVELVAATVSMGLGSQWAVETLYSGLAQGIGAEIVFALLAYRRFSVWVVIVVSYLVYLRKRPDLHKASKFKAPGGAISAWIVLAFMGCMGVILAMWDDTRPGLVYSLIWIAFIVGAAFANRHFLLRRASRGVLGDGGTGEGPHTGPHLHE